MNVRKMFAVGMLIAAATVSARAGDRLPGNLSYNGGVTSPFEGANLNVGRLEQGFVIAGSKRMALTPFVALQYQTDGSRFDWNNKAEGMAGMKAVATFSHGMIEAGGAYMAERRTMSKQTDSGPVGFVNFWSGWHMPTVQASRYPGYTWGSLGNTSPVEKNNVIGAVYFRQGVVVHRFGKAALVPFGEGLFKGDSRKYDWNNTAVMGAGMGLNIPIGTAAFEIGGSYRFENRRLSHTSAQGLAWIANFWYGWGQNGGN